MRVFYFVGGPTRGNEGAFVQRLRELGGPPAGRSVYPFADDSGRALHLVRADAEDAVDAHLARFAPGYERGPVIELVAPRRASTPAQAVQHLAPAGRQAAEPSR